MILRLLPPLLFLASGTLLVEALGARRGRPLFVRLAWGYLAGVAGTGLFLFAASLLGVPLRAPLVLTALALPGVAALLARSHRRSMLAPRAPRATWLLPIAAAAPVTAALLVSAAGRPLTDWDGRAIWAAHARYMRAEGSVAPVALRDARFLVEHPAYPPMMPLAQVAALESLGLGDDDRGVRPIYVLFLPALVLVAADLASLLAGARAAALASSLLPLVPQLTYIESGGASGGYSDVPLAAFWGGGLLVLLSRDGRDRALAGLLLAAAVATKNEGAPLVFLALAVAALPPWRGRLRTLAVPAALAAFSFALLSRFRFLIANRLDEGYFQAFSVRALATGLEENFLRALGEVARQLGAPAAWGVFWPLVFLTIAAGFRSLRRLSVRRLALVAVASWSLPLAGYAITRHADVIWLVQTTANRFALQLLVPATLLAAAGLREVLHAPRTAETRGAALSTALAVGALALSVGAALRHTPPPSCPCLPAVLLDEDPTLPAAIDGPPEGAVVRGTLVVRGWSKDEKGPSDVLDVWIDDDTRPCRGFERAGERFEAHYAFEKGDEGPHRLRVRFWSPTGRARTVARSFTWRR